MSTSFKLNNPLKVLKKTFPGPVSYQRVQTGTASLVFPDYTAHALGRLK